MPFLGKLSREMPPALGASHGLAAESVMVWGRDVYMPGNVAVPPSPFRPPALNTERRTCANPECTGGWKMPWRDRRRPIFEGQWGCSTRCMQSIIRSAIRRERGDVAVMADEGTPHRHRVPLGLVMLAQGWITQPQLRKALDVQRSANEGRIGDWLIQECGVSREQVTRGLSVQWSCPVLSMDGFAPAAMALVLPRLFLEELGLLPLRVAGSRILYLAFKEHLDASSAFAIEQMSGLKVESGLVGETQFEAARARLLESNFVQVKAVAVSDQETLAVKIAKILDQAQPVGARLVRIHQHYWLRIWLESGAYSGVGSLPATGEDVSDTVFTVGSRA